MSNLVKQLYTPPWLVRRGENVAVTVDLDSETIPDVSDILESVTSIHTTVGGLTRGVGAVAVQSKV